MISQVYYLLRGDRHITWGDEDLPVLHCLHQNRAGVGRPVRETSLISFAPSDCRQKKMLHSRGPYY